MTTLGWIRIMVAAAILVPIATFMAGRASITLGDRVDCPEDAVLVWSGQTDSHSRCLTWDDLSEEEYPE